MRKQKWRPERNNLSENCLQFFSYLNDTDKYMVTLDRIKILTDKKHIDKIDSNVTTTILKNNIGEAVRYSQKNPFNIYMNFGLQNNTCIIEFSSKLLLDRYPELINKNNIHDCLRNLNNVGFCTLDIDGILQDSELLSCDSTTDMSGIVHPDKLAIKSCLNNYDKFRLQKYGYNGFTVTKMVTTTNRQIRITLYDKGKELKMKKNANFIGMLADSEAMLAHFDGIYRLETNIKTKSQIRHLFKTDTTKLMDVLNSDANPLLTLFDEVFTLPEEPKQQLNEMPSPLAYPELKMIKNALLLEKCEYDMEKVDNILRRTLSPNTNKKSYRDEFKNLLNSYPQSNKNIQVMKKIREKLNTP